MEYLPLFMRVRGQPCVVVGGGEVAARKANLLLEAGAEVTVVAPDLGPNLSALAAAGDVVHRRDRFRPAHLAGARVAIAATGDGAVNRAVAAAAREENVPVNVVDRPELCSFILPAIVERASVVAAVSTGGASPVLARLLRARLERAIPASFGRLAALAREYRERVKGRFADPQARRRFWERTLEGPVAEMVHSGREDSAREALEAALESADTVSPPRGEVYLVGAGPGDPDLLTLRALRLMQRADVVLHDRLVAPAILDLTRRDAERVYVGKSRGDHTMRQAEINRHLVRFAREGRRVLRLKGGDPFIFGRGGEEIDTLAAEGIPFQVVPGITAASGCAAYAGIPLTHRDHAHSCQFVTGHAARGTVDLDWDALSRPGQTIVFYMALHGLPIICRNLIEHGTPPSMPAALIQQGTTREQRVLIGTLESLPDIVAAEAPRPPTLVIVGEVVSLRGKLAWFEPGGE